MNFYEQENLICNEECKNGVKGCPYTSCKKRYDANPTT